MRNSDDAILKELLSYRDDAYRLALRFTRNVESAEEATQEAYLRVIRSELEIPPEPERRRWFLGIAMSMARNQIRSDRSRSIRERKKFSTQDAATPASTKGVEARDALAHALDALDENLRMAVSLRYEHGMSFKEAAGILSVTESSVRVYVSRGVKALRETLAGQGHVVAPSVIVALLGQGFEVTAPPSLSAALEHIATTGQLPAARSQSARAHARREPAKAPPGKSAVIAGVLAATLGGGIFWVASREPSPAAQPERQGGSASETGPQPSPGQDRVLFEDRVEDGIAPWTTENLKLEHVQASVDGKQVWVLSATATAPGRRGYAQAKLRRFPPALAIEYSAMLKELTTPEAGGAVSLYVTEDAGSSAPAPSLHLDRNKWYRWRLEYYIPNGKAETASYPILFRSYVDGKLHFEKTIEGKAVDAIGINSLDSRVQYKDLRAIEIEPLAGPERK